MSLQDIQSNSIRGDYMRSIVDKTINEIHDVMVTVFGPNAMDAYITRNQEPYFTRDGKEVISSLKFNNELSMYILKLIYQQSTIRLLRWVMARLLLQYSTRTCTRPYGTTRQLTAGKIGTMWYGISTSGYASWQYLWMRNYSSPWYSPAPRTLS